jgi:hypothetical protein
MRHDRDLDSVGCNAQRRSVFDAVVAQLARASTIFNITA